MWFFLSIFLISIIFIIVGICLITWIVYHYSKHITTAKTYFDQLVLTNQTVAEITKEECEHKMIALQSCKIVFSTGWLIFWWFFGFGIGFIICLILGISNNLSRTTYKNQELSRLQMKITNFVNQEIYQKGN